MRLPGLGKENLQPGGWQLKLSDEEGSRLALGFDH